MGNLNKKWYHILMLLDKKQAGVSPFEDVKEQIHSRIKAEKQQGAFDRWLREALKVAKVQKNDALIDSITIRTEE